MKYEIHDTPPHIQKIMILAEPIQYSYLQWGARQMGVATLLEQAIKDAGEAEG